MRHFKLHGHMLRKGCASGSAFMPREKALSLDFKGSEDVESLASSKCSVSLGAICNMECRNRSLIRVFYLLILVIRENKIVISIRDL